MRRFIFSSFLLLVCMLAPGLLQGQSPDGAGDVLSDTVASRELILMPGDCVELLVWREEDMTGEFQVDEDGVVVLPLVGEWQVTERPWRELKDEILAAFRRELRNPSIQITPYRRVFVLGEVTEPGLYPVDPTISLAGAVATAGGANMEGDLRRIRVIRDGRVILDGISGEEALSNLDVRSGDEIYVQRRNWFERNSTFLITAALSLTTILVTFISR